MNAPVYRSRLIEVQLPAAFAQGAVVPFPDQPDLRNAVVTGLESFTAANVANGPSGTAAISVADALAAVVTITEASDEKVRFVPYQSLNRQLNAGLFREYRNLRPTYDQCGIRAVAPFAAGAASVALILVHYYYPSDLR